MALIRSMVMPEDESPAAAGSVPKSLPLAGGTFGWRAFIGKADAHGMFPSELKAVILLGESQEFPLGFQPMRESSSRR